MQRKSVCFGLLAYTATFGAALAISQTIMPATSPGNNGAGPNGIAVTPTELLFTQPYCSGSQTRGIYKENLAAGTSSLLSTIPDPGPCAENYLAISSGLGGFTAGDTFVTGASTTNNGSSEVFRNGSTPFVNPIPNSQDHVGVTFDQSGTFGFNLIVTAQGSVSSGALPQKAKAPTPLLR